MSVINYGEVTDSTKLYQIIKDLLDAYKANIEAAGAVAEGDLKTAATYAAKKWQLKWKGEMLQLSIMLPEHWQYIEAGRGPTQNNEGGVLYDAILHWISVKHIVPLPNPKTGKIPSTESLAYAITKKIHRRGYFDPDHHGKYPLRNAIEETGVSARFVSALVDQFNRAIKVQISADLTKITQK